MSIKPLKQFIKLNWLVFSVMGVLTIAMAFTYPFGILFLWGGFTISSDLLEVIKDCVLYKN
jgi:hypothetical protein